MNPLGMMANYVLTGQSPAMQFGIGNQREALGLQQSDVMPQGLMPQGGNPFAGFLQGLQGFFGGGQQRAVEVPIGPQMLSEKAQGGVTSIGGIGGAAYNDAVSIALGGGATQEMADAAGRNAAGLVAQGMDPAAAAALASMTATGQVGPEMPGGMPAPGGQMQQSNMSQILEALNQSILQGTSTMEQFGPQETGGGFAPSDFGGYGGGVAGETGAPGESSFGLDR
jgi:hypothetical protein